MAKPYNYHKLERQTGFVKKPSIRQRIATARKRHESYAKAVANYDEELVVVNDDGTVKVIAQKASECKFGIFYKKGYRALSIFKTREEAEERLAKSRRPDLYDIREMEWFEEDKGE